MKRTTILTTCKLTILTRDIHAMSTHAPGSKCLVHKKRTNVATRLKQSNVLSAWIIATKIVPKEQKRAELEFEGTLQSGSLKYPLLNTPMDCIFKNHKELNSYKTCVETHKTIATDAENKPYQSNYEIGIVTLRNER